MAVGEVDRTAGANALLCGACSSGASADGATGTVGDADGTAGASALLALSCGSGASADGAWPIAVRTTLALPCNDDSSAAAAGLTTPSMAGENLADNNGAALTGNATCPAVVPAGATAVATMGAAPTRLWGDTERNKRGGGTTGVEDRDDGRCGSTSPTARRGGGTMGVEGGEHCRCGNPSFAVSVCPATPTAGCRTATLCWRSWLESLAITTARAAEPRSAPGC